MAPGRENCPTSRPGHTATPIAVVAHTSRAALANRLALTVDAHKVLFDDGDLGCTRNHFRAWAWHATGRTDGWAVVLEDDAVPAPSFRDQLDAALAAAPAPVISLYLGREHPTYIQPRIAAAIVRAHDACWITSRRVHHAVALAIRGDLINDMLRHLSLRKPIDEAISDWMGRRVHRAAYAWPSLVNHADLATTITGRPPTARPRRAWRVGGRTHWTDKVVNL